MPGPLMQENSTTTSAPARPGNLRRLARLARLAWLPAWLRRTLVWLFWLGYFGFALLVLALRYSVLPNIESYREDIARGISRAVGLPVTIRRIDTHWNGLRPHLSLRGFSIHDAAGRPGLTFETVETDLSWSSLWHRQLVLHRLEVDAPTLSIRRGRNGRIFIAGIQVNTEASGSDFADWLLAQKRVVVRNATIRWEDEKRGAPPLELRQLNFTLQNDGRRHRFGLTALPPQALAARLDVRGDLRGADLDRLEAWTGKLYAELDYADLAGWRAWVDYPVELPRGSGGMRLWLGFADMQMESMTADIALRDVQLRLARGRPMLDLASLNGRVSGSRHPGGFEFATRKLTLATRDGIALSPTDLALRWTATEGNRPARGELAANGLDLGALRRLVGFLPLDEASQKHLDDYALAGRLYDLKAGWRGDPGAISAYSLRTRFEDLERHAAAYIPGFSGLTGTIEGNEKGGTFTLQSRNVTLDLPMVFTSRKEFEQLAAKIDWKMAGGQVELQLNNVSFSNQDADGSFSGRYATRAEGPGEIDLSGRLTRADGAAVWRYMPLVVNRDVRNWLREAITGGRADNANLQLKGDLKHFPFADGKDGIFRVDAKMAGTQLRFSPDWPGIDNITGDLLFEGKRMLIRADKGNIFDVAISGVSAEIADLEAPEEILVVKGRATGATAGFLRYIESSPVSENIDRFTEGMRATGSGTLALKLTIPLRKVSNTLTEGEYHFVRNELTLDPDLPPLTEASGRLQFTGSSVSMKDASAQLFGSPLVINAATRGDGAVAINAQGSLSIASVRRTHDHRLLEHLSGSTAWRAGVLVKNRTTTARFESNLLGIASSLPPPFNKTSTETLPLRFERSSGPAGGGARAEVRLHLGGVLAAQFLRREERGGMAVERGAIGIGMGEPPALPERGTLVAANVPSFNADFWRSQFPAHGGDGGDPFHVTALNLRVGELIAFSRPFHEVTLKAALADDAWQGQVASQDATGEFAWKKGGKGRLSARLKQFSLNDTRPGYALIEEEPLRELPGLDIVADSFTLRGRKLGRLELMATNEANAWRMDKLAIGSPDGTLQSDGLWREQGTQLNFKLDVADIGRMLERLGYPHAVRRGTAKLEGKVSWAGTPTQIDHATLDGALKAEAANGQFNRLDPGAGRLLGILSLQSLPRRITLDFRDIFTEGFAFDSISGSARVARGVLSTQDLQILGPSASIYIKGEASIPGETQNLRVRVEPALSETLAVGAMIANPAVGAAAWLAQKILKDPLGKMFAFEYAISGGWADPKVEKIQQQTAAKKEESVQ